MCARPARGVAGWKGRFDAKTGTGKHLLDRRVRSPAGPALAE
jgi:hypothetical protein